MMASDGPLTAGRVGDMEPGRVGDKERADRVSSALLPMLLALRSVVCGFPNLLRYIWAMERVGRKWLWEAPDPGGLVATPPR